MHERNKNGIRHHIESTFRAYIDRDWGALCATRAQEWIGFTVRASAFIFVGQD